ncbi:nuclease Le1 [Sistotremastrum niveocremeum HHB9708]|uniref:Nuclease Le1 n=1 Tax=Sistotremastrum niveocremeum HHB9708 TaxID=1314777 RepID=A0A164Q5Z1_9AGAM|nr:nuclease Le1 [Sistotremastrum niveocremeum HHB9708]
MLTTAIFCTCVLAGQAVAWGELGHETVGYVAMQFLAPNALAFVQSSLGATYNESLGPAAPWADTVREEKAYSWSAPLHFIDAEDEPLDGSCSVSQSRDCATGFCTLTAISNYTTRIQDTTLDDMQRQEALKFLDHFIGDIGQPLHVEALEVGGNDITTKCAGKKTNLHATWDTGMITQNLNALYGGSVTTWASTLVARIQSGEYQSEAASWISCSSVTSTQSSKRGLIGTTIEDDVALARKHAFRRSAQDTIPELACPLAWAQDSNTFDCSVVFNFVNGTDLCTGSYFNTAIPIIDTQIAKQGYRLAAWLNVIFDGVTIV